MAMSNRVAREKQAYDQGDVFRQSSRLQSRFWHVFACPNSRYYEAYFEKVIARQAGEAEILDYGCLEGALTETLLKYRPRRIVGIDISEKGIARARENYGHAAEFRVMDAHRLSFADNSFDLVVGRSILHHLEFERAIRELRRVLKPGGYALFIEPLRGNPLGKLFRYLTPGARTRDELPLSRKQIIYADGVFGDQHHLFANLVSVPFSMFTSLFLANPGNLILRICHWIDKKLCTTPLKYWMRTVVLVWEKK